MNKIDKLLHDYNDRFMTNISICIQRYNDQLIDSFSFSHLAEHFLERYAGQLDSLNDLGFITYEEWSRLYALANDHVMNWESKLRKRDLDPKDPQEV